MKHTDLCYFHLQLSWLDWSRSRSRSRSFWSRSRSRSRSRTLWSRHWPLSHYVLVSLTSLHPVTPRLLRTVRLWWYAALHVCLQLTQVSLLQGCCSRRLSLSPRTAWGQNLLTLVSRKSGICLERCGFKLRNAVGTDTHCYLRGIKWFRGGGVNMFVRALIDPCLARPRLTWSYSECAWELVSDKSAEH